MSQVDDWSDGYTSDYLRDLNTYGSASANVPRPSSVVSHRVQYRAPDTSDIPLAPGQNPEGSVYSNASGARMGQTKPASGYRAPAGGGWDVNSSDTNLRFSNESGGKRYARPKRTQSRSRGSAPANGVKTRSAPLSGADVTADVLRSIKADGNTSFANWRQSLVNQGWSQAEADAVRYDPTTGKFMSNASGQAATDHYMREQADKDAGIMADNPGVEGKVSGQTPAKTEGSAQPAPAAETPAKTDTQTSAPVPGRSFITTENTGDNYVPDLSKALSNDSQSEVRTAGGINPFESAESLAAWKQAKLRAFPLTYSDFSGGAPNAEVHRFRTVALDPNSTVADVLTAENEAYKSAAVEKANTDNFGLVESLAVPMPGVPAGYAIKAAAEGRRLYGSVAERLLAPKGPLTGGTRTTLTSADEGLPVGYSLLRNPKIDTSPLAGQTSNLVQQLRAAGIPEDQIAASIARINAGAAGREAAAAGREAAAAGGQAAGREAAAAGGQAAGREAAAAGGQAAGREAAAGGQAATASEQAATASEAAADGGVSELANAGNAGRVERVPALDISMAPNETIYGAIDKFMMDHPGGASAVQDAIELVTGKAPEIERVAEALRALPRGQLDQVFMDLRTIGATIK